MKKPTHPSLPQALPIEAILLDVGKDDVSVGDRNLLVHAAQALGARRITDLKSERLVELGFRENARDILGLPPKSEPCVKIFMTWCCTGSDPAPFLNMAALKSALAPALWVNLNNDCGARRWDAFSGIDLDVMPRTELLNLYSHEDMRSRAIPQILTLDALPAAAPGIARKTAERWFADNHGLVLKSPVTVVALGECPPTGVQDMLVAVCASAEGSVLVTTSPRTRAPLFVRKNPAEQSAQYESDRYWGDLYRRADFIHVYKEDAAENPYPYMRAVADRAIVTSDSMSLPSDFIATGTPLLLARARVSNQPFSDNLVAEGYARWLEPGAEFPPAVAPERPRPNDILQGCVREMIAKRLFGVAP